MTDDDLEQRVQGIVQKLDTLQLSHEYGQLLKELCGKIHEMGKDISTLYEEVGYEGGNTLDDRVREKLRYLEEEITRLKSVPYQAKEFKPGRLGVSLSCPNLDAFNLNGLEVIVSNGEQKYYGTTKCAYGKAFNVGRHTSPLDAYCEFTELPGGTYSIETNHLGQRYGLNVTIDGDTFAELKLDQSNLKKDKAEEPSAAPAEKTPVSTSSTLLPEKPAVSYHSNTPKRIYISDRNILFAVLLATALVGAAIGALAMEYRLQNTITGTMYLAPEQNNP